MSLAKVSKITLFILISSYYTPALAGEVTNAVEMQVSNVVKMQSEQHIDFTIDGGAANIRDSSISGTLVVTGVLTIENSHIGTGAIIGPIKATNLDAYALHVTGHTSLKAQTKVEDLSVTGPLSIQNSDIGRLSLAGPLQSDNCIIAKLDATSNDIHLWDTRVGETSVSYYGTDNKPIVLKLFGKSKIQKLSIHSTTDPMAIVMLDAMTDQTFDKTKVNCLGKVEYKASR